MTMYLAPFDLNFLILILKLKILDFKLRGFKTVKKHYVLLALSTHIAVFHGFSTCAIRKHCKLQHECNIFNYSDLNFKILNFKFKHFNFQFKFEIFNF